LHRIGEDAKRRTLLMNGGNDAVLVGARVLVLVADDNGMAARQRARDHLVAVHERCDFRRKVAVAIVPRAHPCRDVGREAKVLTATRTEDGHHVAERARPPRSILKEPDDRNRRTLKLGQIAVSDR
jgi:hypothetical protein